MPTSRVRNESEFDDAFASRRSFTQPLAHREEPNLLTRISTSASGLARAMSSGMSSGPGGTALDESTTGFEEESKPYSPLNTPKSAPRPKRIRTSTEQIELQEKTKSEKRHLNAVLRTSLGTTIFLLIMLTAIALAPMPTYSDGCFGCCSDDTFCAVSPVPEGLRILTGNGTAADSEVTLEMTSSSGYNTFTGEIRHTCYCSTVRSQEDPQEVRCNCSSTCSHISCTK